MYFEVKFTTTRSSTLPLLSHEHGYFNLVQDKAGQEHLHSLPFPIAFSSTDKNIIK